MSLNWFLLLNLNPLFKKFSYLLLSLSVLSTNLGLTLFLTLLSTSLYLSILLSESAPVSPQNQFHVSSQVLASISPFRAYIFWAYLCCALVSVSLQLCPHLSVPEFQLQTQSSNILSFLALSWCVQVLTWVLCFEVTVSLAASCPSRCFTCHACLVVILPRISCLDP